MHVYSLANISFISVTFDGFSEGQKKTQGGRQRIPYRPKSARLQDTDDQNKQSRAKCIQRGKIAENRK